MLTMYPLYTKNTESQIKQTETQPIDYDMSRGEPITFRPDAEDEPILDELKKRSGLPGAHFARLAASVMWPKFLSGEEPLLRPGESDGPGGKVNGSPAGSAKKPAARS